MDENEAEGMEVVPAGSAQELAVVLHEDKKYYPTAEEVYGPEVEVCSVTSIMELAY